MRTPVFAAVILILINSLNANAQGRYEKAAGFNGSITSMITTVDGGYAVCGTSDSDSGNFVVARYNSSGTRLWMKEFGTGTTEQAIDLTQTLDGGYIVTGKRGYWTFKMLVMKLDSAGSLIWSRELNATNFDRANGVCATTDGGVVIAGRTYDGLLTTAVAFKLSSTGAQMWSRSISGFDDGGYSIIRSNDGKYVMTGITSQGATMNIGIVKFDSSAVYWATSIGSTLQDFTGMNHQLVQTQDGGYVVNGNTSAQNGDFYITKLSSAGTFLWSRTIGTSSPEFATGIAATGNDVFVTGYTQTGNFPNISNAPCLIRVDGAGTLIYSFQYGYTSANTPGAITITPSGNLLIGGKFTNGSYSGNAAISIFDLAGNGCKQRSAWGSTSNASNAYLYTATSGNTTIYTNLVTLNTSTATSETTTCSCGTGTPFTITPSSTSICNGSYGAIYYPYQAGYWYTLYRNGTFVSTTNSSNLLINQGGSYYVVQSGGCGFDTSNTIQISSGTAPTVTVTASGKTKVCEGKTVALTATSSLGVSYQWLKNGGIISGATLPTYSATQSGLYTARVTHNISGCSSTGNSINVVVNPLPPATITATGPTTFCSGDSVVLQANTGSGLTYQWKLFGNDITGAVSNNYPAKLAGNYRVRVYGSNNCTKLSNLIAVNVPCRISNQQEPIQIYPNPSQGIFELMIPENESIVRIHSMDGRLVYENRNYRLSTTIDLSNEGSGVYLLTIENSSGVQYLKIVLTE